MSRYRVLVADPMPIGGLAPLEVEPDFELVQREALPGEALAAALVDFDAVIVRSMTRITRESLARADRLRVIGRAGVGVDNIDVDAATERGIAVLNAPSGNTISAAELTLALLLALVRRIPAADLSMKRGEWDRKSFKGIELYGKTLGLVGAGRIGGEVARRARGFGMRVVAYDPYLSEERARAAEIDLAPLDEVLARADVLSLHTPLTDATRSLIDAAALARLRPGAYIVNAARGGVVDEGALHDALASGHLAGAALDVFEAEPLPPDHPLRRLDNVVMTPHLGAATEEAQQNVAVEIAEAVRDAILEGDYSHAVNAPAIGGEKMRRLRPLLNLAERLGALAAAFTEGGIERVEVRYAGTLDDDPLTMLSAGALVGLFSRILGRGAVNLVNAVHLAESRGIDLERARSGPHPDYGEYIEVRLKSAEREALVAGALPAEGFPRVVRIDEFRVDVPPRGTLVVLRNRDVPGVIGRVGTVLGEAGINIGEYHQARNRPGGQALAAITVEGRLGEEVVEALVGIPEVTEVRQAQLDG
jgi:D-3-phosphoglycerate dehydrogenase